MLVRRKTLTVNVDDILIGGNAPIVVQSMTNTDTADVKNTVQQIIELADAGSELVRITVNNETAAAKVPDIKEKLDQQGYHTPLVGDFHYNGHTLLKLFPECAIALAKYRINPGNVGFGNKKDQQFAEIIELAIQYDKPVRIGVNWGSLDKTILTKLMDENAKRSTPYSAKKVMHEALILSALESAKQAEKLGMNADKIILSCKVSQVQDLVAVYRKLAERCEHPLHLGLTEAGMGSKGIVASTAALAVLLQEGIGDTIRISLTPAPNESRDMEVQVAQEILQTMGVRSFKPLVTACPGCGRTTSTVFQQLTQEIQQYIKIKMKEWRQQYQGVEEMNLAVMGCVVNGPGESKHANIGISLPGTGEQPIAPVFVDGKKVKTLRGDNIASEFIDIIDQYVMNTYSKK